MNISRRVACLSLAAVVGVPSAVLIAGNLNPPAGPIAPTMQDNQQIFDAITALGGMGANACTTAIPGAVRALGTVNFATLPGTGGVTGPFTFYSFRENLNSSAQPAGTRTADNVFITIDMNASVHRLFRLTTVGLTAPVATVTIALNDGASNHVTITLGTVFIKQMSTRMVQRCDGTTAQVADLELQAITVRYTNSTGNFWEWNNNTGIGTGG